VKKIILASLLGTAVMFAAQTSQPAQSANSNPASAPAPAAKKTVAKKAKKHHSKKATAVNNNTSPKPAATK